MCEAKYPEITCSDDQPMDWGEGKNCTFDVSEDTVHLWLILVPELKSSVACLGTLLPANESARASQYKIEPYGERITITYGVLRLLIAKYTGLTAIELQFDRDLNNKPFLRHHPKINFSISHSGIYILIAIGGSRVGADIEKTDTLVDYDLIAEDNFTVDEVNFVRNALSPVDGFYKLWTRKEAMLKAIGTGLINNLKMVPCLDGTHRLSTLSPDDKEAWLIKSFFLKPRYWAAIAGKANKVSYLKFDKNMITYLNTSTVNQKNK